MDTSGRILVFAEQRDAGKGVVLLLKKLGFTDVAFAADPKRALRKLLEAPARLAVLDQQPGSQAPLMILKAMREAPKFKNVQVLALAEAKNGKWAVLAKRDSRIHLLQKPFGAKRFAAVLSKVLAGGKPRAATETAAGPPPDAPAPPAPGEFTLAAGIRLLRRTEYDKAVKTLEKALLKEGPSAALYVALALAAKESGDAGKAAMALERGEEMAASGAEPQAAPAAKAVSRERAQAPEPEPEKAEPATAAGVVHGVWASLPERERRQKAFEHFNPNHDKRHAFRLFIPDYFVVPSGKKGRLQAIDISFTGVGFEAPRPPLERGEGLMVDIYHNDELVLEAFPAKVVRVEDYTVGCAFGDLSRQQETALNQVLKEEQRKGAKTSDEFDMNSKKEKKVIKLSL